MVKVIKKIIISLLIIALLCVLGLITYKVFTLNDVEEKNYLSIYSDESNHICNDFSSNCFKRHISQYIETDSKDAEILSISKGNKVLYYDNGLYLYNLNTKEKKLLFVNYKSISEYLVNGFIYNSETEHYYYDYFLGEKLYSGDYYIGSIEDNGNDYLTFKINNKLSLVNIDDGSIIISNEISNLDNYDYAKYTIDNDYIILDYCKSSGVCKPREVYSSGGSKITSLNDNEYYYIISDQDSSAGGNGIVVYERTTKNSYIKVR